jgi:hypothetical protein
MNRGRTITFKYKHFKYDNNIEKLLSVALTPKDEQELKKIYNNYEALDVRRGYEYIIKDLYIFIEKRYISTTDIANIYGVGNRTVQLWLKELGINRTQKEAQKIAVTKRDYKSMKRPSKKTVISETYDSQLAEVMTVINIKYELNKLLIQELKNYEIIVGITSLGIINAEIGIPVIIIKGSHINKFIVKTEENNLQLGENTLNKNKSYKLLQLSDKNKLTSIVKQIVEEVKGI